MIVDNIEKMRDYGEIQERMSFCEQIGEQVMGRIIKEAGDTRTGSPFLKLQVADMAAEYWHNETQKYVAFRMKFTVKGKVQLCGKDGWSDEDTPEPPEPPVTAGVLMTEGREILTTERMEELRIEG
jgi:hypothetical protein